MLGRVFSGLSKDIEKDAYPTMVTPIGHGAFPMDSRK